MTTRADEADRNLPSLTSLRWYAALVVFLFHLTDRPFRWRPADPFGFGYVGVAFFFVLSGFVLTWSAGRFVRRGQFYWRRFARIYPAHLTMLIVVGLVGLAIPSVAHRTALGAAMQVTLTQSWWPGYRMVEQWNGVSWSLADEAFFYACFPFLLVLLRRSSIRAGAWIAGGALAAGLAAMLGLRHGFGLTGAATAYYNPATRLPEFVLGVWLALAVQRGFRLRVPVSIPLLVTAALAVISWRKLLPAYPLADYVMLPGFALLLVAAAGRDADQLSGPLDRLLRHRVSVWLGEISFGFYLVHTTVITVLWHATGWGREWGLVPGLAPAAVALLASTAMAAALHHGVERPARRALMRLSSSRRTAAAPAGSAPASAG